MTNDEEDNAIEQDEDEEESQNRDVAGNEETPNDPLWKPSCKGPVRRC